MERKHYVRINPGLQLVEKAGLLAKTRERGQDRDYLSPEQVPSSRTGRITSAPPVPPPPTSSNHSKHFSFALIKSLAPSGCFFLYPEPTTRGRIFFSGIACKSRMTNLQVPTTGRKTLQGEILGTHQHSSRTAREAGQQALGDTPKLACRKPGVKGKQNLGALTPKVGSLLLACPVYSLPMV